MQEQNTQEQNVPEQNAQDLGSLQARSRNWPRKMSLLRTVTLRSGDNIKLQPGEGFTNVRLLGDDLDNVKRVEIYAGNKLISTLRSQFVTFDTVKECSLLVTPEGDSIVCPYAPGSVPRVILYTENEMERRRSYSVDIVKISRRTGSCTTLALQRVYLALSDEDTIQDLRIAGPTERLTVRFYGSDEMKIDSVSLSVNGKLFDFNRLADGKWKLFFDQPYTFGKNPARLVIRGTGYTGSRVEQCIMNELKLSNGVVQFTNVY